jgi:hypothetical protein
MKYITPILSAVIFIAIAATAQAQSLADIADKEKQRREEIEGAPEVITNDEVAGYSGGAVSTVTPIALPSAEADSENTGGDDKSAEGDDKSAEEGNTTDPDEPVDITGKPESYWRKTMTDARKKVEDLETEANALTLKLNDLQTQFYNIADGFRRETIQKEIQKTYYEQDLNKENLAKAQEELMNLEKEAKKSGALPGWLD